MSCYACSRRYGMFCKESGCSNCGFSFCLKCLKKEIEVPRRNNQKQKVCLRCYEKLLAAAETANESATADSGNINLVRTKLEPNEIFQITDLPTSLEPVLQPISLTAATASSSTNSKEIAGNLDSEILKRLQGLKQGETLPGDDELRTRLCNLQGFQPKEYSKKDILLSTDQRTEQEKINDLLKQFVEETDIDTNTGVDANDPISEIERRLAALRNVDSTEPKRIADPNTPSDNEEDDATLLKNIIQRYVDETRLPESRDTEVGSLSSELAASIPKNATAEATEELPWCTICNEDAVVRCQSCDGDLFCRSCFKECHQDDEEWRNHITQTYSKPPTFKEDHF